MRDQEFIKIREEKVREGFKKLWKYLVGLLAGGMTIVHFLSIGATVATVKALGLLAYPVFFGLNMLIVSVVLSVPWFRQRIVVTHDRFSSGWWMKIQKRGSFIFVLFAALLVSPMVGALSARLLGLTERRAWLYTFIATLISNIVWISLYLGALSFLTD